MEGEVEYKSSDDADTPNSSADQPLTDEKDDKHEKEDEKQEGHASGKDESNLCIFCHMSDNNEFKLGKFYQLQEENLPVIRAHLYCLFFASGLCQNGSVTEGIQGFLGKDIIKEVNRAKRLKCAYCKKPGASVGCGIKKCKLSYHFPCGKENQAIFRFYDSYESRCPKHVPVQRYPEGEALNSSLINCPVCLEHIPSEPSFDVIKTPCCHNTFVHRDCIQQQALSSGLYFFRCPICNNQEEFKEEMLSFGIHVPERDAAWERDEGAYQELYQRHSKCDVSECQCPFGNSHSKKNGKWQIILCDFCGSVGCHVECGKLESPSQDWACSGCRAMLSSDSGIPANVLPFESTPCKKKGRIRSSMKLKGKSPRAGIKHKKTNKSKSTVQIHVSSDFPSTSRDGISGVFQSKQGKNKSTSKKGQKQKSPPVLTRADLSPVRQPVGKGCRPNAPDLSPISHSFQVTKGGSKKKSGMVQRKLKNGSGMKHSAYAKTINKLEAKKKHLDISKVKKVKGSAQSSSSCSLTATRVPSSSDEQMGGNATSNTSSSKPDLDSFFPSKSKQFQQGLEPVSTYDTPRAFIKRSLDAADGENLEGLPLVRLCTLVCKITRYFGSLKKISASLWKRTLLQTRQDFQMKRLEAGITVQRGSGNSSRRMSMRGKSHLKMRLAPKKGNNETSVRPTRSVVSNKQIIEETLKIHPRELLDLVLKGQKDIDLDTYLCHWDKPHNYFFRQGIPQEEAASKKDSTSEKLARGAAKVVDHIYRSPSNSRGGICTSNDVSSNVSSYDLDKEEEWLVDNDVTYHSSPFSSISQISSSPSPEPTFHSRSENTPSLETVTFRRGRNETSKSDSDVNPSDSWPEECDVDHSVQDGTGNQTVIGESSGDDNSTTRVTGLQRSILKGVSAGSTQIHANEALSVTASPSTSGDTSDDTSDDTRENIPGPVSLDSDAIKWSLRSRKKTPVKKESKGLAIINNEQTPSEEDIVKHSKEQVGTGHKRDRGQASSINNNTMRNVQQDHLYHTDPLVLKVFPNDVLLATTELKARDDLCEKSHKQSVPSSSVTHVHNQSGCRTRNGANTAGTKHHRTKPKEMGKADGLPSSHDCNSAGVMSERRKNTQLPGLEKEKKMTRRISMSARGKSCLPSKRLRDGSQTSVDSKIKLQKTLNDYFTKSVRGDDNVEVSGSSEVCPLVEGIRVDASENVKQVIESQRQNNAADDTESMNPCMKETQTSPQRDNVDPLSHLASTSDRLEERNKEQFNSYTMETSGSLQCNDMQSSSSSDAKSLVKLANKVTTRQMVASFNAHCHTPPHQRNTTVSDVDPQYSWPLIAKRKILNDGELENQNCPPVMNPVKAKSRLKFFVKNADEKKKGVDSSPSGQNSSRTIPDKMGSADEIRMGSDTDNSNTNLELHPERALKSQSLSTGTIGELTHSVDSAKRKYDSYASASKCSEPYSHSTSIPNQPLEDDCVIRRSKRFRRWDSAEGESTSSTDVSGLHSADEIFLMGERNVSPDTSESDACKTSGSTHSEHSNEKLSDNCFYKKSEKTPQKRILLRQPLSLSRIVPPNFTLRDVERSNRRCVSESKLRMSTAYRSKRSKRELAMK